MKTTEKQQVMEAHGDIEKAASAFRVLKERLQLDSDNLMTDRTIMTLIAEKPQIMYMASIIEDYLRNAKKIIKGCVV